MSFSRSGSTAPAFSFPIGVGSFTDVNASNTVFSTYFRGDGGFLSNVNSSIPGTLPNLVISNSLTVTNVFATIYRGDGGLLTNVTATSVVVSGNTLSNLNASNLVFGVVNSALIYGNQISNINSSNIIQPFASANVGTLNVLTISNLNSLALTNNLYTGNAVTTTNLFANTLTLSNASSTINVIGSVTASTFYGVHAGSNTGAFSNLYSANALTTTNLFANTLTLSNASSTINVIGSVTASTFYGVHAGSNTGAFSNLYSANALTTTNIFAAGFTSNASNTIFNYSTLTVPFISSTTLNVASTANVVTLGVTGQSNLATLNVSTANVTTGNVVTLRVTGQSNLASSNLGATFITTLNVSGTSNLSSVVSSGQIVATGKTGVGVCPPIVYRQGGSATNWNTPGSNTTPNVYAITSGAVQMQCGANTMTATTQFIPFPVAYTNNPTVLVTSYGTTGNIWVSSITASNFQVQANAALRFEWLSIGV